MKPVSRGFLKLQHGLKHFQISVEDRVCCDLGSNVGGFVQCLLENGAKKVLSVDTSYGTLDWNLRNNERVMVHERSNALHFRPEEKVSFVSIDVGWTPQEKILPIAWDWLAPQGDIISLLKPQYESSELERKKGTVLPEHLNTVVDRTLEQIKNLNLSNIQITESPILGGKGNREFLVYLRKD